MRWLHFLLIVSWVSTGLITRSQNLVRNGGFENNYKCPDNFTVNFSKRFIPDWIMPTRGTPDYFHRCSKEMVGVPQNFMGSIFPAEGDAFIGLVLLDTPEVSDEIDYRDYLHSGPLMPVTITNAKLPKPDTKHKVKSINYREYVQTKLKTTLQPNQLYRVSFKYALSQNSTFISNRLGVAFSDMPIKQKKGVLSVKPQAFIDSIVVFSTPGIWTEFADTFRARGGEQYLTIGNFFNDSETHYLENDISNLNSSLQKVILTNQLAYYYIDDVRVELVNKDENVDVSMQNVPLSIIKNSELFHYDTLGSHYVILDEVFFDIGQFNSEPKSFCQLDWLIDFLNKNNYIGIELNGFLHEFEPDISGAVARVKSLRNLLISRGVSNERIICKYLDDYKAISKKVRFYKEGLPCDYYSLLISVRFFNINQQPNGKRLER